VQNYKEDWKDYEGTISNLMSCLKNHSEFDVIESAQLRSFMAENFVMNYSNIELHRVMLQQKQNDLHSSSPRSHPRNSFQPQSMQPLASLRNDRPQSSHQMLGYNRQGRPEQFVQ
jgi:hypothetical protein